ncbi:thioesterase-like superfamily-domain-containing protein [Aspergillus ambiguus]|uniref:thioesterase family protein n=1 Tax=Aspergillus ambiguus TaxID=176160 RepID=UPI003CCE48E3
MSLKQQISVQPLPNGHYTSTFRPIRPGTLTANAFGGNLLAVAVTAAYNTVTPSYHLYSLCGHFVRPASTDRRLFCHVRAIRDGKSFRTRQIEVTQRDDDGVDKLCLVALADFHVAEARSMVAYSIAPQTRNMNEETPCYRKSDNIPEQVGMYRGIEAFVEIVPLDGDGHVSGTRDRQRKPAVPGKITRERFRVRAPLDREEEQIAAMAFHLDTGLAYIPALHSEYSLLQASACATLDFSLRVFAHDVSLNEWHTTEQKTVVAGNARAYNEGRMWDGNGRLLASMTQQTILRPRQEFISHL